MKKKLLKTAAIASFLTAAGVVIPQADIFAADTPNTPHPSTLPSAQPSNTPHPSTLPSAQPSNTPHPSTVSNEQPSTNTNSTENMGVKEWSKLYDKKKVDSFADYWIESITRDKNYLTIKTKDNAEVYHAAYMDEENIKEQADNYLIPEKVASNIYRFNTDQLVRGEGENKKFSLSGIDLGDSTYDKNGYIFSKVRDINGNVTESVAYAPVIKLNAIDLYKYADVTRVVGSKATVEKDPKLPEVGDKDYVVYTDKSQVALNGTIKTIVKYKPGVKKYSDVLNEKYVGKDKNGLLGFENIFSTAEHLTITGDKDEQNGSFVGWYLMDKNGNDVFYSSLKGVNPGHYNITKLFGLDITKGNFDNADFTITAGGKSVYRTDKAEQPKVEEPKVEEPKVEEPKVEEPKVIKPVEPTFPKVELPEKPKTKILEQKVGDRKVSVHFDGTKIPATNFYAEEVKDKDELAELTKELKAVNPKYKLVNVYDLKLIDSLGNTVDSVGSKRTVTLTNTKGKSVVYYVYRDQNNKLQLEKLPTYDGGNGNIVTFEAEHFSKYALVEEQTDGKQPEGPRVPQPAKLKGDKNTGSNWNTFAQGQKAKEGSTEVKSETGEVATKPLSNRKEGKALPNTGLQTTSYGFLAAIVGLFGAVALRRKNR